MNHRKLNLLFFLLSLNTLLCCSDNDSTAILSKTVNSNQGISIDSLDLIYDGPEKFTLEYFPKVAIKNSNVKECEIIQIDSTDRRVARKVQFDRNGNIIREENNFFFYWFKGTATGTYWYQYQGDRKIKMLGIPEKDSKDSIMVIWNYNTQGFLYSTDDYQYEKRLKQGADGHLPSPSDFEKYRTWNKQKTNQFLFNHNTVTIETLVENKQIYYEKYQFLFDSSKRLKVVTKFRDDSLEETTEYTYGPKSITAFSEMNMNESSKLIYKSKAVLNDKGVQIEKILFNNDGTEKVKMIVFYNDNGTIKRIKYENVIQEFVYKFY